MASIPIGSVFSPPPSTGGTPVASNDPLSAPPTGPEKQNLDQFAQIVASLEQLIKTVEAQSLTQLSGMQQPQTPSQQANLPGAGTTIAPYAGVAGGPPLAHNFGPQGVLFGGGSPVPVPRDPARLQNTLVAIRDLINAGSQFRNSPLGAKLGEFLGGGGK